jgi:hypothetical protein
MGLKPIVRRSRTMKERRTNAPEVLKTSRGPFLTESQVRNPKLRNIVVVLHSTFMELRQAGAQRSYVLDYEKAFTIAARAEGERKQREKAKERKERRQ